MDKLIPLIKLEKFEEDIDVLRAPSNDKKITTNEMEIKDSELEELHHSIDIKEEDAAKLEYQDDSNEDTLWRSNKPSQFEREEMELKLEDSDNIQGETSIHLRKVESKLSGKLFGREISYCKSGEKLLTCEICGYKSALRYNLTRHLKTHQGQKPIKCEICEYKCARVDYLKNHLITHSGEKSFKCEICDYKFARKEHLKTHLGTCPEEKSFKCEICGYKCVRMDYLKNHLKTHTGEKPFICEICDYKCAQKGTLNKHLKTHTGEKRSRLKHFHIQ